MTRGSFIALLAMGAVVVALGIGYFELAGKVDARLDGGIDLASDGGGGGSGGDDRQMRSALRALQSQLDQYRETNSGRVGKLEERLARVEAEASFVTPVAAGGEPVAAAPLSGGLEQQVNQIIDRRDEARKKADAERRVGRMTDFFLREINATDDQRKRFTTIVAAFWDARGKISRQKYPNPEDRRAAMEALSTERNQKLQEVFDPGQMTQLTERLDRMNRGGPTGRGGRGGGGNGGRGR
jgi:hypothetical protein